MSENIPGNIVFENAFDFSVVQTLGSAAIYIDYCFWVASHADPGDDVKGLVQASIAVAVESMAGGVA